MAGQNLSNADAALKDLYVGPAREQLNNTNVISAHIERRTKDVVGRRAVLSLHVKRNSGVGARADGGTLPAAGRQGYAEERVLLKFQYGRIEITGPTIKAMRSDEGSFVRAVDSEMKGLVNDLKRDENRQYWGTGDGVIVTLAAGSTTTVFNFATTAKASQIRQIEVGMVIDVGTASPFTSVGTEREVTAVSATTFTVSPAVAVAPAAGDSVVRSGSGGSGAAQKELTGLQAIVAASGTLFNVDPNVNPVWASQVYTAAADRPLTENLLAQAIHGGAIASGTEASLIVTDDASYRSYAAQLTPQKRFNDSRDLKGGFKGLSIAAGTAESSLTWDRDAPSGEVFGLSPDHLVLHEMSDWEWMDDDGAVLSRVSGVDAYEATMYKYRELTTDARNSHWRIKNVLGA